MVGLGLSIAIRVDRDEDVHWPSDAVLKVFPQVDFTRIFRYPHNYCGLAINTSRRGRGSSLFTVDVALGNNVRRNEDNFIGMLETTGRLVGIDSIDQMIVTDQGHKLLTAFLAARV